MSSKITRRAWYSLNFRFSIFSDLLQNLHVTDIALRPTSCGLPQWKQVIAMRSLGIGTFDSTVAIGFAAKDGCRR